MENPSANDEHTERELKARTLELTHKCDLLQGRLHLQTLNLDSVPASIMAIDGENAAFLMPSPIRLGLIAIGKAALETTHYHEGKNLAG